MDGRDVSIFFGVALVSHIYFADSCHFGLIFPISIHNKIWDTKFLIIALRNRMLYAHISTVLSTKTIVEKNGDECLIPQMVPEFRK